MCVLFLVDVLVFSMFKCALNGATRSCLGVLSGLSAQDVYELAKARRLRLGA